MKKFYTFLFTIVLLCSALITEAQGTYNSITSNPLGYTLDDANFWIGGVPPPNGCTGCTININSSVSMVQNGFSSVPEYNSCLTDPTPCAFLNTVTLNGGTINVYGNTTLSMNTYLILNGVTVTLGNNQSDVETFMVNGQILMDATSSIRLASANTKINTNNDANIAPTGPNADYGHPTDFSAGILATLPIPVNGFAYGVVLNGNGYGTNRAPSTTYFNSSGYSLNCGLANPANTCAGGIVYGPVQTFVDPVYGPTFENAIPLPVQLVQFIGTKQDDGSVKLNWATAQESNADYFDVERSGTSTTSESGWVSIGRVAAKGNSSITTNYTLTDKTPLPGTGYYKLKMVDKDSKTAYSKIISVSDAKDDRPLVIYSNPFTDQIRLKVNLGRAQNLKLTVTDMLGRSVITSNYPALVGDNFINLTPKAGGSGMYILHITGDTYDKTVKLEKQ